MARRERRVCLSGLSQDKAADTANRTAPIEEIDWNAIPAMPLQRRKKLRRYHGEISYLVVILSALTWGARRTSVPQILHPELTDRSPALGMQQAARRLGVADRIPPEEWRCLQPYEGRRLTWGPLCEPGEDTPRRCAELAQIRQVKDFLSQCPKKAGKQTFPYIRDCMVLRGEAAYKGLPIGNADKVHGYGGSPINAMMRLDWFRRDAGRRRREVGETICPDCGAPVDRNERHILLECRAYRGPRRKIFAKIRRWAPELLEGDARATPRELASIILGNARGGTARNRHQRLQRSIAQEMYELWARYTTLQKRRSNATLAAGTARARALAEATSTRPSHARRAVVRRRLLWQPVPPIDPRQHAVPMQANAPYDVRGRGSFAHIDVIRLTRTPTAAVIGVCVEIPNQRRRWRVRQIPWRAPSTPALMAILADMLETLTDETPRGLRIAGGTAEFLQHITGVVRDPRTDGSLARIWRWAASHNIPIAITWKTSHLREALRERMWIHPLSMEMNTPVPSSFPP